ncbi:unnamed protein product [Pieris brassicae]|uniref:Uncharacterized protein n=1 Tax=Pieris brassicae TaxID=7116 RepID=A0A9P0SHU7_PIEBR|nr:unnamed protein product [Pieris brassicae]CAH3842916.1 unnamed protein product [Pieris brassicae]
MSIEAMRKVEQLEKENRSLKMKLQGENEATEAVSAKLDAGERKEKKHLQDEHPIRLRRSHDRTKKTHKK